MSFADLDEYGCNLVDEDDNNSFHAFLGTIHQDVQLQDCQAFPPSNDAREFQQLGSNAQHYAVNKALLAKGDFAELSECKDLYGWDGDELTTQPSPPASHAPSSEEGFQTPVGFDGSAITYNLADSQPDPRIREPFERILCADECLQSSHLTSFILERDPWELTKEKMLISHNSHVGDSSSLDLRNINIKPRFEFKEPEEVLEMPSPQNPFVTFASLPLTPLTPMIPDATTKKSKSKATTPEEEKPKNSRQSQFKNAYSLAVEQVKRLLSDWLSISMNGHEMKKLEQEERKTDAVLMEEEKEIKAAFDEFEANEQKLNDINERIDALKDLKKIKPEQKAELDSLVKERSSIPVYSKNERESLVEKLKYKRFGLLPFLSGLINDSPNAFIKRTELSACLKDYPKVRTLKCMKEYFAERLNFGLLISRVSVELLASASEETCEPALWNRSNLALRYWLTKSHMQPKTRNLFMNQASRDHIQGEIKKIYFELEEIAKEKSTEQELNIYEEYLQGYEKKLSSLSDSERDTFRQKSVIASLKCGKRAAKDGKGGKMSLFEEMGEELPRKFASAPYKK